MTQYVYKRTHFHSNIFPFQIKKGPDKGKKVLVVKRHIPLDQISSISMR